MKTEVKPVAENEVLVAVEVPQDEVQRRYEQTLTRLARETSLPGFRKGKVPRQMVVQRLGADYILNEALQEFLPEWYESALTTADVDAVSMPELDLQAINAGEPFSFTAKVQVRPTPVLGQYKGVEVPKRKVEVGDDQVEGQLAMMQERFSNLEPVEDRPVQEGDFIVADLQGESEGKPLEGANASDYMLQVGSEHLIPGFSEHLVGASAGAHLEFEVTFPDDYVAEELRGKPASFVVDVKEIKQKALPELNDAFAQDVSEFETLEELKEDLRERLGRARSAAVEREFRGRVVDAVADLATFSVPPAMIEREAHSLLHELESAVAQQGVTMDVYLAIVEKTKEQLEEELKPRAEQNVRRRLVLDAIRAAEGIEVSDDELRARIKEDAETLGRDGDQLVLDVYASGRDAMIRDEQLMAKTVDFLVEHAVPVDMPAEEAEEAAADADAVTAAVNAAGEAATAAATDDEASAATAADGDAFTAAADEEQGN